MKTTRFYLLTLLASFCLSAAAQDSFSHETTESSSSLTATEATPSQSSTSAPRSEGKPKPGVPPVVHSAIGDSSTGTQPGLHIYNIGKRQQFSGSDRATFDTDILSPKSATFSHDGKLLFINSLEGCKTAVYKIPSLEKDTVFKYEFSSGTGPLWASPSGFYTFTHYPDGASRGFGGKPVESAWTHNGRYLWVPFYRRTFDINAQDPSAMAVIDTHTRKIIRMFETGPLPKVVASSPDNHWIAVAHWGNNTVGIIDCSSNDPKQWHHLSPITIGRKLELNFPLDHSVNRDANSGYLLRGTVFTPDSRYMLVAGMAGPMSVIDMKEQKLIGTTNDFYGVRHLAISNGTLYGSINISGQAISAQLDSLLAGVEDARRAGSSTIRIHGDVKHVKVGGGARTLEVSPDGRYLFVACNSASAVYVVEASTMKVVDNIRCDSYPVGLAISPDGRYLAVTSQGREGFGGNAVNLFEIRRTDIPPIVIESEQTDTIPTFEKEHPLLARRSKIDIKACLVGGVLILLTSIVFSILIKREKKKNRTKSEEENEK